MQTDEFYFGVTFQGNKRIFTPKGRNGKLHLPGQWAGSFSEDRPLGWDPVAAGNRAGDGMARFVSEEEASDPLVCPTDIQRRE